MKTTALLLLPLLAPLLAQAGTPFPHAGIPYFIAMQDFRKNAAKLLIKKCLPEATVKPMENMLEKSTELQKKAASETDSYMAVVSAPMPGSGKCDGGFEAVAAESEKRRGRTLQSMSSWKSMMNDLAGSMDETLNSKDTFFLAKDGDQSCAQDAQDALNKLKETASDTGKKMEAVVAALQFEATRFENYTSQNKALQARCGQAEPGTVFQAVLPPDFSAPKSADVKGKSKNGKSDVTGIKEDLAKRKELEGADRSHFTQMQVHAQKLDAEAGVARPSQSSNSDITGEIISKLDGYAKLMERSPGGANGALPMGAQQSAGAAFWDLPKNSEHTQNLELKSQVTEAANPATDGKILAAGGRGASSPEISASLIGSAARSQQFTQSNEPQIPSAVKPFNPNEGKTSRAPASELLQEGTIAGSEENLFELVHERYRLTEHFRRAKVTKVPLNSFDSNLQR